MAISPKGEALKAKNLEAQKAFAETQGVSASVTPAVANIGGQPAPVKTLGQKGKRRAEMYANETPEQKNQRNAGEVQRISNMIAETSDAKRAFEKPNSQGLGQLSSVSEKSKNPITAPSGNAATSFNKDVDANIALGMNAQDAYNAAMKKNVAPSTVAPVYARFSKEKFKTIAGVGTTPGAQEVGGINPAAPTIQMQADSAKIEPPAPVAPVSAPVVPASMKEPVATPPVAKVEAPKFMTDVQRREQLGEVDKQASRDQMLANVDIMAKEDGSVLTDRAKFEAKTGYAGKPPEEQAILDTYFKSNVPTTAGDIKKQLFAGVEIKDPKILNTPAYRQAKFEKDRLSRYTGMSSEQLFNEMKNGLPTQASEALRGTPAYQEAMAKYDNYKKVDNINNTAKFIATGKSPEKDPLAELSNQLSNIFGQQDQTGSTAEAYRSFISQNPEITEPTAEYNTKMAQKKEFERAREAIVEDLKKKYAGEPLSTILSIAARESKPINDQINTLNDSLTTLAADIKFKTDLATQEFGFYTEDQKAKAAKQAKLQDLLGGLAVSQFGRAQDQAFTRETQAQNQAFDIQKMDIAQKYQADRDTQNYLQDLQKMGVSNIYDLQKLSKSQDFQKELLSLNQKYENSRSVRDFQNDIAKMGLTFDMQRQGKALDLEDSMAMEEYKASLDPDKAEKWEAIRQKATENSSLADLYGRNVGTYQGNRGYDLAGKMGDAIVAPPGAKVIGFNSVNEDGTVSQISESGSMSIKDPGYGNSVLLQLPDGKFMRLSHLQDIGVNLGDTLSGGQLVGTRGNTGNVRGRNGEILTPEQKAAGRGAHVDVEISNDSTFSKDSLLNQAQQLSYLKAIKPFGKTGAKTDTGYTEGDIALFNSAKYNPQTDKDAKRVEKYYAYSNDRAVMQTSPDASALDLMKYSRGQKDLGQAENKAYKDINTVVGQLGSLNKSIAEYNKKGIFGGTALAPVAGLIASNNPWDTKAQQIQAQLQALVPKVARGVFGEVGVLTDQDIANYMKTLPNIKQTANVQDVVQFALLDTLKNSLDSAIAIDSGTYDISGLAGQYKKLNSKIEELRNKVVEPTQGGMSTATGTQFIDQFN